jgi:hypothetical protein
MALTYRLLKDAELTYTEGDANIKYLDLKMKLSSVAPAVTNDGSQGFTANESTWFDYTTGYLYLCTDTTVGAAVWSVKLKDTTYTDAEIKTKYEANADTNVFTDAEKSKLSALDMDDIAPTNLIGTPTEISTSTELFSHVESAGVMSGCAITENVDGTVSFAAGYGLIRATADATTPLYAVEISAQLNLALTDNSTNYVYFDYNAGAPTFKSTTDFSVINCMDKCLTYVIYRKSTVLDTIDLRGQNVDVSTKARQLFLNFSRFIHAEGGTVLSQPSSLAIGLTAGAFYMALKRIDHVAFDTSVAGTANENVFTLYYRDGVGGFTEVADSKLINTTQYDNNTGTLATLSNNRFGVSWVYLINNTPSRLAVVVGQAEYSSQTEANNATPPTIIPTILGGLGSLVGFVTYAKSGTSFSNVLSAFTQSFTSSSAIVYLPQGTTGTTAERPTTNLLIGQYYKDTSLGKPIWWSGVAWEDGLGTVV